MHARGPSFPQLFLQGAARERQPTCIEERDQFVCPGHPDQHWRRVRDSTKDSFAVTCHLQRRYPVCDIGDGGEGKATLVCLDRVQSDVNAEFAAVFSKAMDFPTGIQGLDNRMASESC